MDLYTQVVELPLNLFKYPLATAEDPPGVQVNLVGSRCLKTPLEMPPFACFTQGQWSDPANISYIVLHCVFSLLFSHPHPSPPPPPSPRLPTPGAPCSPRSRSWQGLPLPSLTPLLLSFSRLFPPSSYFCLLSAFISLSPRAGGAQLPEQYKSIT